MKTLISTLFLALLSLGMQAQVELANLETNLGDAANEQVYQQFYEALLTGDFKAAKSYLSPDFSLEGMDAEPLDANAYLKIWQGYHTDSHKQKMQGGIQALNTNLENMAGNWVGAWFEASWTENDNNQPFSTWIHQLARIENGKISLIYHFENPLSYLMQAGYQLVPPTGEDK